MTDKERFLKSRLPEQDVDIPGVGTVRVRSLSRAEAGRLKTFVDGDAEAGEVFVLAVGLVDPRLTEDEVRQWMAAAPTDEVELVAGAVMVLSGLVEGAETVRRFPPGAAVGSGTATGVLSGPDVGDDGGPPP
jgi:hypothetical protein